jgi:hypothetical protein
VTCQLMMNRIPNSFSIVFVYKVFDQVGSMDQTNPLI